MEVERPMVREEMEATLRFPPSANMRQLKGLMTKVVGTASVQPEALVVDAMEIDREQSAAASENPQGKGEASGANGSETEAVKIQNGDGVDPELLRKQRELQVRLSIMRLQKEIKDLEIHSAGRAATYEFRDIEGVVERFTGDDGPEVTK